MKNLKRHIVTVLCVLLTLSSYAKAPTRLETLNRALKLAEAGRYQDAIDRISRIEDATVVEDNILANAQVLKFNIGLKISNDQYQTEAIEMLKSLVAFNPEDLSEFRESLLGMIIRYERAKYTFEDRMCGIWVSPTQNFQGTFDGAPLYRLTVYKEGGKYKAKLNFSDSIVLTTEDMMFDSSSNILEIYGGDGKFNKGTSRFMTEVLVGTVGQTAQDMHEVVSMRHKSDLVSLDNYAGQAAVALTSGLLQALLTEASVSKTKAFSTVISCQEIAPGIIDMSAEEVDREIRSDGANNFTVKRGHVRLYKVPFDIAPQSPYLYSGQPCKVKYVYAYIQSLKPGVVFTLDNGLYGETDGMKESELRNRYLGNKARGKNLSEIAKSVNLSTNKLVEQFYTDKYQDLLYDIFQRDFHGVSHRTAQIPYSGEVTPEKMDTVIKHIRDFFYNMEDYENALSYFEEDYSKGKFESGLEYFQLATCRSRMECPGDIDVALEGIDRFPKFSLLYSFVLKRLCREQQFDSRYKALADAWIKSEGSSPRPHYFCGRWYEAAGDRLAAIEEYGKSTERDPKFYFSDIRAGELLFENARDAFGRHDDVGEIIQTLHDSASKFESAISYTKKNLTRYVLEYLCTIYTFLLYNDPANTTEYSLQLQKYSCF